MEIFALFMLTGFFLSWLIPETKGRTLEELSGETVEDALRITMAADAQKRTEKDRRAIANLGGGDPEIKLLEG